MYKCRHFIIQELVDPQTYKDRGEKAWELFDVNALRTLDALRDMFGPITCNNWHIGGNRKWSGLRTQDCFIGAKYSQHKLGCAFDLLFRDISSEDARAIVIKERNRKFPYITGLELNITWFHFDTRNHQPLKCFGA